MRLIFRLPVLITLWFCVCNGAAVIPIGKESSESTRSISKDFDHNGSRNNIHATNAQTNQRLKDFYEKPFERFSFRAVVKRSLKPSFVRITVTAAPSLSDAFVANNDPRENGRTINEATVIGNMRLPISLKVRAKRCGKANAQLAKITSTLKASKQFRVQHGNSHKTSTPNTTSTDRENSMKMISEGTALLMNVSENKGAQNITNSSQSNSAYTTPFTSTRSTSLSTSSTEQSSSHNNVSTASTPVTSGKDDLTESLSDETTVGFAATTAGDSLASDPPEGDSTTIENIVETTENPEITTDDSSSTDEAITTIMTLSTTPTETVVIESSASTEAGASSLKTLSTAELTSTKTDVTESVTESEVDMSSMETINTTNESSSSLTETDVMDSSTVSTAATSSMETVTATTLTFSSLSTEVTPEHSSAETEITSNTETATYSTTITNETDTSDLRSTESPATLSMSITEIHTKDYSDTRKTSTAIVTDSEITDTHTTSVVRSTEAESTLSTVEDGRSSTVDELIENRDKHKVALSPGKIAWIVIGILMVLAAFTGGIFLGNRYRTVYKKREDTIALVVRNQNHRFYY